MKTKGGQKKKKKQKKKTHPCLHEVFRVAGVRAKPPLSLGPLRALGSEHVAVCPGGEGRGAGEEEGGRGRGKGEGGGVSVDFPEILLII